MSIKRDILWRVGVVYLGVILLGFAILGRVLYLQIAKSSYYKEKAREITLRDITIHANRGDILASDGRILSSSVPYYDIRMDMKSPGLDDHTFYTKLDSLAADLAWLFKDKTTRQFKAELLSARRQGNRYFLIRRRVNYNQLKKLKEFPIFNLGQFKGGLVVVQENRRIQPHTSLASRTIGYTTKSTSGNVVGIEGAYDVELKGVNGIKLMQRLPGGVWIPINDENEVEPADGNDVVTTIDVDIQDVAESALKYQLSLHGAHHGSAILMEVKTGDIKAITNLERQENGFYSETYNYAIGESTEPGSTFKLASIMAALEDGYINLEDTIDTENGVVYYYNKGIRDTETHGKITVQQVLELSSNVGVAKIITENYKGKERKFIERLYSMNLNEKLGIEIRGEGKPEIKYPGDKYWSGISMPMMAHGYEIRMTPLQILSFYNAVANNGELVKPRFVKEIRYHGHVIRTIEKQVINPSICSKSTIKKAKIMLEGVVERGTAKNLRDVNCKIAGKTGTAQIANEKKGYRSAARITYQASFVGYFPANNPKYSCIVVVNSPSNEVYYGNLVAGPVFKEIADKVMATSLNLHETLTDSRERPLEAPFTKAGNYVELANVLEKLDIPVQEPPKNSTYVSTSMRDSMIVCRDLVFAQSLVPNVKEMGAKDAVYMLENIGLRVSVIGRGKVAAQSLTPGSKYIRGQQIELKMSFL